jgi:tetratricopeptide (TPR) repeat protein
VLTLWLATERIGRGPLTAALFFVGTLLPVLGFMNAYFMYYSFVSDHWTYLSSLGLIALAAALVTRLSERLRSPATLYSFAGVVLPLFAILSWRHTWTFQNLETLWRDTLAKNPNAWLAHNNLGVVISSQGNNADAMAHYQECIRLNPNFPEAYNNLGSSLGQLGKYEQAIEQYKLALQCYPEFAEAQYNWGAALVNMGKDAEAIPHFEEALRFNSELFEAQRDLGVIYLRMQKYQEAAAHFSAAAIIDPTSAEAENNLALCLFQSGRRREAIAHWERTLQIKPAYPVAQNGLAWLLATLGPAQGGDPARAVALAERACDLTGHQLPGYLDTLAAAYAAAGRFNDAIATAQKAVELAHSAGQSQLAGEIQARLKLYRGGHAYTLDTEPKVGSP